MKQVPYRCRFDHITIVCFSYRNPTLGTVECEECKKLAGVEIVETKNYKNGNRGGLVRIVRAGEMAVRI